MAKFSRKHYNKIAKVISKTETLANATGHDDMEAMRRWIAKDMAKLFEDDNERFNKKMFLEACNLK